MGGCWQDHVDIDLLSVHCDLSILHIVVDFLHEFLPPVHVDCSLLPTSRSSSSGGGGGGCGGCGGGGGGCGAGSKSPSYTGVRHGGGDRGRSQAGAGAGQRQRDKESPRLALGGLHEAGL